MMRSVLCSIGNFLSRLYARVLLITVVRKTTNFPQGPKIYVVNHPNTLDPFYLLGIIGERVSILIIEHVFHIPILGKLIARAGHLKLRPGVYREAKQTLLSGRSLLLFSEGDISYTPSRLRLFHTGAVRLAIETGAPIIPIGIHLDPRKIYKRQTMIKHQSLVVTWYRYGWYTVVFGEPVYIQGSSKHHAYVRRETAMIRRHVISCVQEAQIVAREDMILHSRTVKHGLYIALRGVYKCACFIVFVLVKLNSVGVKILG